MTTRTSCRSLVMVLAFLVALTFAEEGRGFMPQTSVPSLSSLSPDTQQDSQGSVPQNSRRNRARAEKPSCFGEDKDVPDVDLQQPQNGTEGLSLLELSEQMVPGDYGQFFMKLVPGIHGKLYGRTLVAPCRCEACAYVLDTLVMYLDEDTMGWFLPDDVEHVMQDRFCYGVKWIYRSACHHILSAYYEEIITMVMGHLTGVDMCRVLRFCPFHFSSGNWMWPQKNPLSLDSASNSMVN